MSAANQAREARFNEYLDAVNEGITRRKEQVPFRLLWRAYRRRYRDQDLGVAVYKNVPDHPYDYFTVRLTEHGLELAEHGKTEDVEHEWLMADLHLEHVLEAPERYKRRPVRLQFDWLRTRLGTEARARTEDLRDRAFRAGRTAASDEASPSDVDRTATEA